MNRRVDIGRSEAALDRVTPSMPPPHGPPAPDGASLAQVAGAGFRSSLSRARGSAPWRGVADWSRQPLVTNRGTVLLMAAIVAIMLGQALTYRAAREPARPPVPPGPISRRPAPLTVVQPATPTPVSAELGEPPQVVGIVGRLPGNAVVLVRGAGGTHSVAVGGVSGDWTLVELSPTEAVFERHGARRTVELAATE